jgi:phage-related tail protein
MVITTQVFNLVHTNNLHLIRSMSSDWKVIWYAQCQTIEKSSDTLNVKRLKSHLIRSMSNDWKVIWYAQCQTIEKSSDTLNVKRLKSHLIRSMSNDWKVKSEVFGSKKIKRYKQNSQNRPYAWERWSLVKPAIYLREVIFSKTGHIPERGDL